MVLSERMKLWYTEEMSGLPAVIQNGLSNPCLNEMTFSANAEYVADQAMQPGEDEGYAYAFLEVEIPDKELDDYFVYCMELNRLDIDEGAQPALDDLIAEGGPQDAIDGLTAG